MRGIIVLALFLPALFWLGRLLDPLLFASPISFVAFAFALSLFLRQHRLWADIIRDSKIAGPKQYDLTRDNVMRATFGFTDGVACNLVLFAVGGFSLLLPYRFLRAAIDQKIGLNVARPDSPFLRPFWLIGELAALPGSILATLAIAAAHIFIPGTHLVAFLAPLRGRKGALPSRLMPLSALAHGLNLSFRFAPGKRQPWIGPKDGRAKQTGADLRKAGLVLVVATLLGLLAVLMLLAFTLATP
ncbi:hypothetical protein ACFO5Q_12635 [Kordiimonas lipolytica]|uniref:Cobalamin biosynthesis protein CobD n=1 Tax=Kordiimonas lipolytica TaxID=1662421 RepID=A0ABV8UBX4_9PROT|nr:hypothetical protein [Kordiimonas lipolytica]